MGFLNKHLDMLSLSTAIQIQCTEETTNSLENTIATVQTSSNYEVPTSEDTRVRESLRRKGSYAGGDWEHIGIRNTHQLHYIVDFMLLWVLSTMFL